MASYEKWRKKADQLLAAPIRKKRSLNTVVGKVEDCFNAIFAARQRGMAWKDIALAIEDGTTINVDAVESAFKRICEERGLTPPDKPASRQASRPKLPDAAPTDDASTPIVKTTDAIDDARAEIGSGSGNPDERSADPESDKGTDLFGSRWVDDGE